jgi:NAD(P)-dependent dehydrogenase (short-subunit alcohol dehydrogenase family)
VNFSHKIILITGGAMGIGAATARRLAAEGARVLIVDRNEVFAEETVELISGSGGQATFCQADLTEASDITRMAEEVLTNFEVLHGLVNNAGITRRVSVADMSDETWGSLWNEVINLNLVAPLMITHALLPGLVRGPGHIVNLSSMGAYMARPNESVYDATKAGLSSVTRSMASEFASHGIRVNAVAPGAIITEMHIGTGPDRDEKRLEFEEYEYELALLRRWGRPEEIASVIAFLLGDDASYITGTTIHADGGVVMA